MVTAADTLVDEFDSALRLRVEREVVMAVGRDARQKSLLYEFDAACADMRCDFVRWCKEKGLI